MSRDSFFARSLAPLLAYALVNTACGASIDQPGDSGRDVDASGDVVAIGDSGTPTRQLRYPPPVCTGSSDEAPIPDGVGGHVCTYVGANRNTATGDWPDLTMEIGPFVYVRTSASQPGDGTAARPFRTIAEAVMSTLPKRTIVLGPGTYDAVGGYQFTGPVTIIGTGAGGAAASGHGGGGGGGDGGVDASVSDGSPSDGSAGADASADAEVRDAVDDAEVTDAGPHEATGTTIAGHDVIGISVDGSAANVTLRRLQITGDGSAASIGALVTNAALLTLDHVTISNVGTGVSVIESSLRATGLTVLDTVVAAVWLQTGSNAVLNGFHLRDGGGRGILADRSTLSASEGLVTGFATGGVILRGSSPSGMDRIDRVVVASNTVVGIGASNTASAPVERTVDFSLVSVSDTRAGAVRGGGYGIYLRDAIAARFDVSILSDTRRGFGSESLANARGGLVVSGASARLELHGARLSSNRGPGLMLQNGAAAGRVGYSAFNDNDGVGAMISSGAILAYFLCNELAANHLASIAFASRAATIGDGLLVATTNEPAANLSMIGDSFTDNDRFGALFVGGRVEVGVRNVAERNRAGNGRTSTTMATGLSEFIPEGFNTPPGTDLPLEVDVLPEPAL